MRTLLRHTRTGLFFLGPEKWTDDPREAYDFHFIERALHYVTDWEMNEVELAFAFEDTPSVTTAPLEKAGMRFAA